MKRITGFLVLVMALAAFCVEPSDTTRYAYDWGMNARVDTICTHAGFDTLGAADSCTLKASWSPQTGWQYVLIVGPITGTGSDSVKFAVVANCYDANRVYLGTVAIDTVTVATWRKIEIPLASSIWGNSIDLKAKAITGQGTQVILNRIYFGRRK